MATATEHLFVPQTQIAHVVNDRFLGLYSIKELPNYYRPTKEATAFAERLIRRVVSDADVRLVLGLHLDGSDFQGSWEEARNRGLDFIEGPAGLSEELDDLPGAQGFLWDRGPLESSLLKEGLVEAGDYNG
jgi:hypothetical protein